MRLESIRPGGTFHGSLDRYPFPALLVEVLRSNLSGRLDLALHPEDRNAVTFRNGVPVRVELPDIGPTLISLLVEEGLFDEDEGLELVRCADATAVSESRLLEARGLLEGGALREARVRRARSQLIRLFNQPELDFRLTEGTDALDPSEITLLEPLPLLFRGLLAASHETAAARYLPPDGRELRLGPNYPGGVDPFGFGAELERAILESPSVSGLVARGFSTPEAEAAVASLVLAEMVELAPRDEPARRPKGAKALIPEEDEPPAEGLIVHRRSGGRTLIKGTSSPAATPAPSLPPSAPSPATSSPSLDLASSSQDDRRALERRLGPLEGKTYFQILRVVPDTEAAQLERAYRFLQRRTQEEPPDAGTRALAGLLREAYVYLRDPQRSARYAATKDAERFALEAEPKIERALRALGEGRDEEARYLLAWASRLAPFRSELGALSAAVDWLIDPQRDASMSPKAALATEAQRTGDRRLKLALTAVLAQEGDLRGARAVLVDLGTVDHPVVGRFVSQGDR